MTAPVTPLQLAAMRAIRAHEQEFARGIMPAQLQNAVGCQPDQMLNTLESKHWVERDDEGWWLTDDGLDVLEELGEDPSSANYLWAGDDEVRLTKQQLVALRGIDEHWREHGRGPTRYELARRIQRVGAKHIVRALCQKGLVEQARGVDGSRVIWLLAITDAGRRRLLFANQEGVS